MKEATFRIFAGDCFVDVKVIVEGLPLEVLLELQEDSPLEESVYLREPRASKPSEIRSFLTAMKGIETVQANTWDSVIEITVGATNGLGVRENRLSLELAPDLVQDPKDARRTLAGNLGLLYSLCLYLFEKKHGIVSYHSGALVDEKNKIVFVCAGDFSSGKSVLMLDYMTYYGKDSDYRVLSTEMGHFAIQDGGLTFYSGASFDNVSLFAAEPEKIRLLKDLFPESEFPDPNAVNMTDEIRGSDGSIKTAVSTKEYYARKSRYSSKEGYKLVYLLPEISIGRATKKPVLLRGSEYDGLFSTLVGIARQKLGQKQPSWIYDERASLLLPVEFLSREQEKEAWLIEESLKKEYLEGVIRIEGDPKDFNRQPGRYWEDVAKLLSLK